MHSLVLMSVSPMLVAQVIINYTAECTSYEVPLYPHPQGFSVVTINTGVDISAGRVTKSFEVIPSMGHPAKISQVDGETRVRHTVAHCTLDTEQSHWHSSALAIRVQWIQNWKSFVDVDLTIFCLHLVPRCSLYVSSGFVQRAVALGLQIPIDMRDSVRASWKHPPSAEIFVKVRALLLWSCVVGKAQFGGSASTVCSQLGLDPWHNLFPVIPQSCSETRRSVATRKSAHTDS